MKMPRARLARVTLAAGVFAGLLAAVAGIWRSRLQAEERIRQAVDPGVGIATLEAVEIGGVQQWIRIRGRQRDRPVLFFVHGGPGFPQMPFAAVMRELEDDFVVVHWDQRGAGKSYALGTSAETMRLEQFVADLHEVVSKVLARLQRPKCYLVAHSWGSIFSALEVSRHPELYFAYVGVGQIAHYQDNELERYHFALREALKFQNETAVAELRRIGPPPHADMSLCDVMDRWVSFFSKREFSGVSPSVFAQLALASPDYAWTDLGRIPLGFRFSYRALWREIYYKTDLAQQAGRFEVPVTFVSGRFDRIAPVGAVRRYFDAVDARAGKDLIVFEHSAHWPFFEEPLAFAKLLRGIAGKSASRGENADPPAR